MNKSFEDSFNPLAVTIHKILGLVSEERRPFISFRVANSLLFRAGSSFLFYLRSPARNAASLNEAIALRGEATRYYEDKEDRLNADVEGIVTYFSPNAPVTAQRKVKSNDPILMQAAMLMADNLEAIKADQLKETGFLKTALPTLKGFLNGAKYDRVDIQPSEMAIDRARIAASAAAKAIVDRIERDVLTCQGRMKLALEVFEFSNSVDDKLNLGKWMGEVTLAQADLASVKGAIKTEGWDS